MISVIDDTIRRDQRLLQAVDRANIILSEIANGSVVSATASWNLASDRNRPCVDLELSDFTGSIRAHFLPSDLGDSNRLQRRLRELWGDLLQVHLDVQIPKLVAMIGQPVED